MRVRLDIERAWKKVDYTIGRFFVNGIRFHESLEDPDRGLDSSMSLDEIKALKIPGKTAIPTGTYKVILSPSPKYKDRSWAKKYNGLVPEIVGVPGYVGARIHPANFASEIEGCVAVGENKVRGGVINSQKTYCELMDKYLMPAWYAGDEMSITIR